MKVYSINPNTNKYFIDNSEVVLSNGLYQGTYRWTPIYPLYTFSTNSRYDYNNTQPEIEITTMLPINSLFNNYLVEVKFIYRIEVFNTNSINDVITKFTYDCEIQKNKIDINNLVS